MTDFEAYKVFAPILRQKIAHGPMVLRLDGSSEIGEHLLSLSVHTFL